MAGGREADEADGLSRGGGIVTWVGQRHQERVNSFAKGAPSSSHLLQSTHHSPRINSRSSWLLEEEQTVRGQAGGKPGPPHQPSCCAYWLSQGCQKWLVHVVRRAQSLSPTLLFLPPREKKIVLSFCCERKLTLHMQREEGEGKPDRQGEGRGEYIKDVLGVPGKLEEFRQKEL